MGPAERGLTAARRGSAGPVRTCIGCRRRAPAGELVRVTVSAEGGLVVGRGMPGRGAWLCRGEARCLRLAARRRAFGRALRTSVPAASVASLATELGIDLGGDPGRAPT